MLQKKGFGGCYGSNWIQGSWPENWGNYHINILEMYPVMALIETFDTNLEILS